MRRKPESDPTTAARAGHARGRAPGSRTAGCRRCSGSARASPSRAPGRCREARSSRTRRSRARSGATWRRRSTSARSRTSSSSARGASPAAARSAASSRPRSSGSCRPASTRSFPRTPSWHPVDDLPPLAFDHGEIVLAGRERLRGKLSYTNVGFALAPAAFTLSELRDLYAAALGHDVSATNLKRVLLRRERARARPARGASRGARAAAPPRSTASASARLEITDPFATLRPPGAGTGRGSPIRVTRSRRTRCARPKREVRGRERVCMRWGDRTTTCSRCSASSSPFLQQLSSSPRPRRRPAATTSSTAPPAPSAPPCAPRSTPARSTGTSCRSRSRSTSVAYGTSSATPGHVWLDRGLLASGRFAWATVMDEYAHQVDFFVLDSRAPRTAPAAARRQRLVLRGLGPRTRSPRLRAVRLDGRVGLLALEAQRVPARRRPPTSRRPCRPREFRSLVSAVVGMPTPVSALISG